MSDILNRLARLRRPHLLIRAARIGADDYQRGIHLPRLLGTGLPPRHGVALEMLMEIEAEMDHSRRQNAADYAMIKHVEVMIAVIAESRVLRATQAQLFTQPEQSECPAVARPVSARSQPSLAAC